MYGWKEIPNETRENGIQRYITVICDVCGAVIKIIKIEKDDYDDIEVYASPHECSIWRDND